MPDQMAGISSAFCSSRPKISNGRPVDFPAQLSSYSEVAFRSLIAQQNFGDQAAPSRLVASSTSAPRIPVEILMERYEISPIRIIIEQLAVTEHGPLAGVVPQEKLLESVRQLVGDPIQRFHLA